MLAPPRVIVVLGYFGNLSRQIVSMLIGSVDTYPIKASLGLFLHLKPTADLGQSLQLLSHLLTIQ